MKFSLAAKLTLAFLAVSLSGILLVAVLAGQTTASEFGLYMFDQSQATLLDELAAYYRAAGGWDGVEAVIQSGGMGMGPMHGSMMSGGLALADGQGRVVVAGLGHHVGSQLSSAELAAGQPVKVNGQQVGTLFSRRGAFQATTPAATQFLARVNRALALGALGAAAAALALAGFLARRLTRSLREITAATQAVARGQLGQPVPVRSQDELGQLAAAFNRMSADLARARDLRRQMTADIAHDLRTPLSVILGHAEALRDGVLPPTPETLSLVHEEAQRLNRLIDDLRTLSLAEAGELSLNRRPARPGALLEQAAAAMTPRAQRQGIALEVEAAPGLPEITADPDRLAQVLGNLLDNAFRHTPPGGRIRLEAALQGQLVRLAVRDTGPGIAAQDLPHIFERFYRADKSRARGDEQSSSGLGLSIARSLVEAHQGRLWAESPAEGGAHFFIELPL